MSKEQLVEEFSKLSPEDRAEVLDRFIAMDGEKPSDTEKALLDEALDEYERNPDDCIPWEEAKTQIFGAEK